MTRDVQERVRRGAKLLDSRPELTGWRDRIDLTTLDLGSASHCVLGQVYLDAATKEAAERGFPFYGCAYFHGEDALGLATYADVVAHGFNFVDYDDDLPILDEAWRTYLRSREWRTRELSSVKMALRALRRFLWG